MQNRQRTNPSERAPRRPYPLTKNGRTDQREMFYFNEARPKQAGRLAESMLKVEPQTMIASLFLRALQFLSPFFGLVGHAPGFVERDDALACLEQSSFGSSRDLGCAPASSPRIRGARMARRHRISSVPTGSLPPGCGSRNSASRPVTSARVPPGLGATDFQPGRVYRPCRLGRGSTSSSACRGVRAERRLAPLKSPPRIMAKLRGAGRRPDRPWPGFSSPAA